ncbi:MAG: class I SAM-dependent methyltransferase [Desulfobacteraceae bacterium]|nr:MAG: class I SAM-dependent methyltransferase [Desulfobacteraceae bacterium]
MLTIEAIKWKFRRLYLPVSSDTLVLEVGSGGNPYPRSNVLLDAYEETRERHYDPLVHDRPTVLAFGENLPFRDKTFDFVIAAHVLEHTHKPEKFLEELQRVAHAGYIETPDAFMERINPYKDHRLEVTLRNDCLMIRKKDAWVVDASLVELYEERAKRWVTQQLIPDHPADFHVRYYWKDRINYQIINPKTDASWQPVDSNNIMENMLKGQYIRHMILKLFRRVLSQTRRNSRIELLPLLRCPSCHKGEISMLGAWIVCGNCKSKYKVDQGVYFMHSQKTRNR